MRSNPAILWQLGLAYVAPVFGLVGYTRDLLNEGDDGTFTSRHDDLLMSFARALSFHYKENPAVLLYPDTADGRVKCFIKDISTRVLILPYRMYLLMEIINKEPQLVD